MKTLEQLLEKELAEFDLDNMHHKAKGNLIKVAELIMTLDDKSWLDFVVEEALDLSQIASEAVVSRSSLYQNPHIKKYITHKANELYQKKIITALPYKAKVKNSSVEPIERVSFGGGDILREKEREIKELGIQVTELKSQIDELKSQLKEKSNELANKEKQTHLYDAHLCRTGRLPR